MRLKPMQVLHGRPRRPSLRSANYVPCRGKDTVSSPSPICWLTFKFCTLPAALSHISSLARSLSNIRDNALKNVLRSDSPPKHRTISRGRSVCNHIDRIGHSCPLQLPFETARTAGTVRRSSAICVLVQSNVLLCANVLELYALGIMACPPIDYAIHWHASSRVCIIAPVAH